MVIPKKRLTGSLKDGGNKMQCVSCKESTTILAHQIRNGVETPVCLDCADYYYQDQLTKILIKTSKAGA
jgi:hypothetical protein